MQFIISGLKKTSLLDYPDKLSAIVFTQGCNFRCGYCHNPDLLQLTNKESIYSTDAFFEFLKMRKGKLDGVVITGGEPTLQKDLIPFIEKIKDLDFLVKLDSNGYRPDVLSEIFNKKLIDYIAMDIKAPLEKYSQITCINTDIEKIKQSINLILNSGIPYEFRTTVLKSQLSFVDFEKISKLISGADKYFLQKFEVKTRIQNENLINEQTYSNEEFKKIIQILKSEIKNVELR